MKFTGADLSKGPGRDVGQLVRYIAAPAGQRPVTLDATGVEIARANLGECSCRRQFQMLAVGIVAPANQRAVTLDGAGMQTARTHLDEGPAGDIVQLTVGV